jgi:hypothetical protein
MGPDYVGVGSLDAGIDWWHGALCAHPEVDSRRLRRKRSLDFFDEFCERPMTDADVEAYRSAFPSRRGRLAGEWSARYAYDAWTPPLLARAAPEAKLLLLVSDPIERYRLRLARHLARGRSYDPVRFMTDMTNRGRYLAQLERLTRWFPRERVLVLQYERCRADPLAEYARTLRFLGLSDDHVPRALRKPAPAAPERAPLWPDLDDSLHAEFDGHVKAFADAVPEVDLSLWPNFSALPR